MNFYSAVVETFLPAPLKPNFRIVLRSQSTAGPSSIFLLVSTRNEAVSGRGGSLLASRSAASSAQCWKAHYILTRHPLQFLTSSSFIVPHCGHSVIFIPPSYIGLLAYVVFIYILHQTMFLSTVGDSRQGYALQDMACQLDQPHTHGFCDRLRTVGHLQLAVDVLHFALYGHFTPELAGGNLFIAASGRRQAH